MQKTKNTYKKSGVNINLADRFVEHIAKISKKNVLKKNKYLIKDNIGAFGSIFDIFATYLTKLSARFILTPLFLYVFFVFCMNKMVTT